MKALVTRFFKEESGQGMTEYALILALVAIAAVVLLGSLGDQVKGVFGRVVEELGGEVE